MIRCISFVALMVLLAGACNAQEPKLDVPYVPTPEPVVAKMLEMANVKDGDVVYDLGCGDGRIVIAAARDHGARGVGVDIDPQRIAESNENARTAGVTDKVKFVEQDLFKMDFSEADVLTLYLLPSVNLKLRDTILELKPGTRVVSHSFDMGEWEADEQAEVEGRFVYFWLVPAKVQGTWNWEAETPQGRQPVTVTLQQEFQKVSGTAKVGEQDYELVDAKIKGEKVSFALKPSAEAGQATAMRYEGRVDGDSIRGRMLDGAGEAQAAAARDQATQEQQTDQPNGGAEWVARRQSN